jgi:hypothetical protein
LLVCGNSVCGTESDCCGLSSLALAVSAVANLPLSTPVAAGEKRLRWQNLTVILAADSSRTSRATRRFHPIWTVLDLNMEVIAAIGKEMRPTQPETARVHGHN